MRGHFLEIKSPLTDYFYNRAKKICIAYDSFVLYIDRDITRMESVNK